MHWRLLQRVFGLVKYAGCHHGLASRTAFLLSVRCRQPVFLRERMLCKRSHCGGAGRGFLSFTPRAKVLVYQRAQVTIWRGAKLASENLGGHGWIRLIEIARHANKLPCCIGI